jgi:hypothetical protein
MLSLPFQTIVPFIASALMVILITVIAEKFGTKIGGILGTIPTTIIIAYIFIALNRGVDFASASIAVVPAEIGINILFIFITVVLIKRSIFKAFAVSFTFWAFASFILWYTNLENVFISIPIFLFSMIGTFIVLEKKNQVKSISKKMVHYTIKKIMYRGILAGLVISISVLLSNVGPVLSGIFSVFPAIITSTMIICYYEHGPDFASGMAKSMIFGSTSVMSYAVTIHFTYPIYGIVLGSLIAFIISLIIAMVNLKLRAFIS